MHEIVTLQFGRQANYVGTHFWNVQDSYLNSDPTGNTTNNTSTSGSSHGANQASPSSIDHDILFRQGISADGTDTYLPRLAIYDLRGGFGSLARLNAIDADTDDSADGNIWGGGLTRIQSQIPEPSPYIQSLIAQQPPTFPTASTTQYFADFSSTFFHPRSLVPVAPSHPELDFGSQISANEAPSFKTFADGSSLFEEQNTLHDFYDRDLRRWIEECDFMQGIQVFTSSDDAWAGFSSAYVEEIRDQLGKGSIWTWGLNDLEHRVHNQSTRLLKMFNSALILASMHSHSSLYVPIGLPGVLDKSLGLDKRLLWHTSALVSAGIESATLPLRLRSSGDKPSPTISDWEGALGDGGRRRVAEIALESASKRDLQPNGKIPNGGSDDIRTQDAYVLEDEAEEQEAVDSDLSVNLFQSLPSSVGTSRGFRQKTFARIDTFRGRGWHVPNSLSIVEQDMRYMRRDRQVIEVFQTDAPLYPLVATFPHIFTKAAAPSQTEIPGMKVHTSLRTSSNVANWVRNVRNTIGRTSAAMLAMTASGTERESLLNDLGMLADSYIEGWDSGGEESDDEF